MSVYRDIYEKISASQTGVDLHRMAGRTVRLIKLQEEVGEVSQAYIGYLGANARKGNSHAGEDVAKELCDVVITAMVALHDWTADPTDLLITQVAALRERIKREGS
jgi:hypothetical protein